MAIHPILANYEGNLDDINWEHLDKETYIEIENIFTDNVKFFDPFLVEDFYPQDMFEELLDIFSQQKLAEIDFSNQMNKWEQRINIPQKFIDYAVNRVKELLNVDDVIYKYHMYAHHQITADGRVPKLPVHVDWAPGSYMIDLHMGGNRDWGFVAGEKEFITKPNQAVICQPEFDYHYRPGWSTDNPEDFYQVLFFHLVHDSHWSNTNEETSTRSEYLNSKYDFGHHFRDTEVFAKFQKQRNAIFERGYIVNQEKLADEGKVSRIWWDGTPNADDASVHDRKNVLPKKMEI